MDLLMFRDFIVDTICVTFFNGFETICLSKQWF